MKSPKKQRAITQLRTKLLKALHEPDFTKAEVDAQERKDFAERKFVNATKEKATIEFLYDEVERERKEIKKPLPPF